MNPKLEHSPSAGIPWADALPRERFGATIRFRGVTQNREVLLYTLREMRSGSSICSWCRMPARNG